MWAKGMLMLGRDTYSHTVSHLLQPAARTDAAGVWLLGYFLFYYLKYIVYM